MKKKRMRNHKISKEMKLKIGPNPVKCTCKKDGTEFFSHRGGKPKCPECSGASTTKSPWVKLPGRVTTPEAVDNRP